MDDQSRLKQAQTTTLAKAPRRAAIGFIFAAAVMDILALGIIIPVLPQLVRQFTHGDNANAAHYVGWFGFIFGLMQFIFSPIIGALSDRFGRRPVLLVSIFGLGFDYLLMGVAPTIGWLFLGRMISGVTAASFSTASAYIADITPPEKRAKSFGLMGAAFGVGFTIGPAFGGFLSHLGGNLQGLGLALNHLGGLFSAPGGLLIHMGGAIGVDNLRLPFWVAAGLALVNGLYGLFVLPESLPKDRRAAFNLAKANPAGSFELLRSHPQLLGLGSVLFFYYLAHQVLQSTFVLYTAQRYHWDAQMMGFNLMAVGVGNIIVQAAVVGPFVKRFGERGALYTGLACGAIGFLIYATAATSWQFWCGQPVFALMGLVQPGYQGLMTRRVKPNEQGRLQGANSGLMAMAGIFGPLLFTGVFAWSISHAGVALGEGTAVYLASGLLILALAMAIAVTRHEGAETAKA